MLSWHRFKFHSIDCDLIFIDILFFKQSRWCVGDYIYNTNWRIFLHIFTTLINVDIFSLRIRVNLETSNSTFKFTLIDDYRFYAFTFTFTEFSLSVPPQLGFSLQFCGVVSLHVQTEACWKSQSRWKAVQTGNIDVVTSMLDSAIASNRVVISTAEHHSPVLTVPG